MEKNTGLNEAENSMIEFDNFKELLKQNIACEKNIFNRQVQELLLLFYSKVDDNFIHSNFIDNSYHYIEFHHNKQNSFFSVHYSKEDIHIVIEETEIIYFYDDIKFKENLKRILESLFYGLYTVKSIYKKDKLIRQEVHFDDSNLSQSSIKNRFFRFFDFFTSKKATTFIEQKGINWIK